MTEYEKMMLIAMRKKEHKEFSWSDWFASFSIKERKKMKKLREKNFKEWMRELKKPITITLYVK